MPRAELTPWNRPSDPVRKPRAGLNRQQREQYASSRGLHATYDRTIGPTVTGTEAREMALSRMGLTFAVTGEAVPLEPPPDPEATEPCPRCGLLLRPTAKTCRGCATHQPLRTYPCYRCGQPNRLTARQQSQGDLCTLCQQAEATKATKRRRGGR